MDVFGLLGGPPERFLGGMLPQAGDVPMALQRFTEYHRENAHRIQPYADARPTLVALRARGVKLGVWTGRDRGSTEWLLRQHRLESMFSAVVCGDDLASHKPDPAGLREILLQLQAAPGETLLVGDADVDVLGGAACGVDTVLIRHGRAIDGQISDKSWRVVASPLEAYTLVLGCLPEAT
jgi:HAD superfamily hydrolase (TIGR01509 family)